MFPEDPIVIARNSQASWLKDGIRGNQPPAPPLPVPVQPGAQFPKASYHPPFPRQEIEVVAEGTTTIAPLTVNFALSNATTVVAGNVVNKVLVQDGKINGEFPSGMGYGNYILNVGGYSDIYAVVIYDPATLEITSRSLGIGSVPSSEFGTLIIYIGFAYFDGPALKCRNAHVGDINFRLVYGALNGEPALLPVQTFGDWIALP